MVIKRKRYYAQEIRIMSFSSKYKKKWSIGI